MLFLVRCSVPACSVVRSAADVGRHGPVGSHRGVQGGEEKPKDCRLRSHGHWGRLEVDLQTHGWSVAIRKGGGRVGQLAFPVLVAGAGKGKGTGKGKRPLSAPVPVIEAQHTARHREPTIGYPERLPLADMNAM